MGSRKELIAVHSPPDDELDRRASPILGLHEEAVDQRKRGSKATHLLF
jgi:hypothetical protein